MYVYIYTYIYIYIQYITVYNMVGNHQTTWAFEKKENDRTQSAVLTVKQREI